MRISTPNQCQCQFNVNYCEWNKILGSAGFISLNWLRVVRNTEFNIVNFGVFKGKLLKLNIAFLHN